MICCPPALLLTSWFKFMSLPLPLLPCIHRRDRHLHVGDGSYPTWCSLIFLHTFNLCLNRILLISLTYLCGLDFVFLPCFPWDGVSRVVCNIEVVNATLIFVSWYSAVFCTILCFFHNHSKSCTCLFKQLLSIDWNLKNSPNDSSFLILPLCI